MKKKKQIVVDSSVAVKWLNSQEEKWLGEADKVLKDVESNKIEIIAPELAKYEIGNALLNKEMELPATKASLATLYTLPIKFISFDLDLAEQAMEIAQSAKITYYDASFLALSEKLKAILVTDNPKHQKVPSTKKTKVIALKNYV